MTFASLPIEEFRYRELILETNPPAHLCFMIYQPNSRCQLLFHPEWKQLMMHAFGKRANLTFMERFRSFLATTETEYCQRGYSREDMFEDFGQMLDEEGYLTLGPAVCISATSFQEASENLTWGFFMRIHESNQREHVRAITALRPRSLIPQPSNRIPYKHQLMVATLEKGMRTTSKSLQ